MKWGQKHVEVVSLQPSLGRNEAKGVDDEWVHLLEQKDDLDPPLLSFSLVSFSSFPLISFLFLSPSWSLVLLPNGPTFFNCTAFSQSHQAWPIAAPPPSPCSFSTKTVIPFSRSSEIWSNSIRPSPPLTGQLSQVLMQGAWLAACYVGMNWLKLFSNLWAQL